MGEVLGKFFIPVDEIPYDVPGFIQVLFLGACYGYILFNASNLISEGSELLLLVPSLAGLVGSVVLPVLGAVPDGAIVLFSGLGPDAQEQLSVGVGALAGSTIMLLTIPWFLSIVGGRVNVLESGELTYKKPKDADPDWKKLDPPNNWSLTQTGVKCNKSIAVNGKIMLLTAITYLVIQIPAFAVIHDTIEQKRSFERWFAFSGMLIAIVCFVLYLVYQFWQAKGEHNQVLEDEIIELRRKALKDGMLTLRGAMFELFRMLEPHDYSPRFSETHGLRGSPSVQQGTVSSTDSVGADGKTRPLLQAFPPKMRHQMKEVLRPFFNELDLDKTGSLDHDEIRIMFRNLNEAPTEREIHDFIKKADMDNSGVIEFEEFVNAMIHYVKKSPEQFSMAVDGMRTSVGSEAAGIGAVEEQDEEEGEDEEEESIPDDLAHLSPEQQQLRIKIRAAYMMLVGTALVLLFSDPMVDVFSSVGERTGVPAFYISFVLAPLASNASELIASYNYSLKKTRKTITIAFAALEGAACMNNTFCLAIFLALVFFRSLVWSFSAETLAILLVELCMGFIAMKRVHLLKDGLFVLALYPLSIMFVWVMENAFGFD
ncbi:unnamed protein product [Vitrella brassicaformis CCMP3155]|uniref:EF-hand domain-containing protein n=2 Tax=Vitrella brassicaformis TaxID=1169539 RepID=A0A0G4GBW8_VITBC|nr:unnamed protein product [Vitrella brassicaformis CCMP3155]|mmetsp:Transcript_45104/g.112045  ORF Transcript_45104/g.112045 Transcript_45104/m.112045 type:complete len:598 (+) Transcript_45104:189-1982(+)|eukprot:CEM26641.1 unnamed protein product [Vitrella brassicaformis CCMP3155]